MLLCCISCLGLDIGTYSEPCADETHNVYMLDDNVIKASRE